MDNYISLVRQKVKSNLGEIRDIYDAVKGKADCRAATLVTDIYNRYTDAFYLFAKRDRFMEAGDFSSAEDCLAGIRSSLEGADDPLNELKNLGCMQNNNTFQTHLVYPLTTVRDMPGTGDNIGKDNVQTLR